MITGAMHASIISNMRTVDVPAPRGHSAYFERLGHFPIRPPGARTIIFGLTGEMVVAEVSSMSTSARLKLWRIISGARDDWSVPQKKTANLWTWSLVPLPTGGGSDSRADGLDRHSLENGRCRKVPYSPSYEAHVKNWEENRLRNSAKDFPGHFCQIRFLRKPRYKSDSKMSTTKIRSAISGAKTNFKSSVRHRPASRPNSPQ